MGRGHPTSRPTSYVTGLEVLLEAKNAEIAKLQSQVEKSNRQYDFAFKLATTWKEVAQKLQAQVERYKKTCKWCGTIHHAGKNTLCPVTQKDKVITDLQAQVAELNTLLRECRKVMKADNLHRGNPDRRGLWDRITAAIKGEK